MGGLPSRPEGRRLGEGGPPGPLRLESAPARARGGKVLAADQALRLGADRFQLGAARPSREERLVALPRALGRGLEAPREGLGFGSRNGLEGGPGRPGPLERAGDRLALRLLDRRAERLALLPPTGPLGGFLLLGVPGLLVGPALARDRARRAAAPTRARAAAASRPSRSARRSTAARATAR
ncbi:MAG: hypothetical protein DMF79_14150 [Acidobacteria bacterium]|nr:MAG: hypothetical protein DMF79_14150 [Acidobacteriota bacterium]